VSPLAGVKPANNLIVERLRGLPGRYAAAPESCRMEVSNVSTALVKELRERTGAGVMDCKRALEEAGGSIDRAIELLRQQGLSKAEKKAGREARQGLVESYVHQGRIGVLVELNCETDFVARTDDFKALARELALQVAGTSPQFVSVDEISDAERQVGLKDHGSEKAFIEATVLLAQPALRQPSRTVEELVRDAIAKIGENIVVRRFVRFELGETGSNNTGEAA
jgi:elongation factor Ts